MDNTADHTLEECLPNVVTHKPELKIQNMSKPTILKIRDVNESDHLTLKQELENYQICERCLAFIEYFGILLGVDLSYNWKVNVRFAPTLFLLFAFVSQLTYTQYLHVNNQEYYRLLETLACYGVTTSVKSDNIYMMALKLWLLLVGFKQKFKVLRSLFNSTIEICKTISASSLENKIRDRLLSNSKFYKWTGFVIILSIGIFVAYPMKAFVVDNERISLLPIEFMFVDQSTISGFIIANLSMTVMGFFATLATAFMILVIVQTILNYSIWVDVLEVDIQSLDDMWSEPSDMKEGYRYSFMKNICRKQQDMNVYVDEVKKVLDGYFFLYFCTSYFGQIVCLFQIVVSDWKPGYGIAYGMFLEMMFYCLMGTMLSSANERASYALQQSNWYSYDIPSQKVFLTLYIASSNAKELRIGSLAPLTVATGNDIVKSIYTYYNLMLELV